MAYEGSEIHIIGAKGDLGFTKNLKFIPWEESNEAAKISAFDVGIMPLEETPWEKGKCAYKLIQYMACGLAVVAAPVGMNNEVVREGKNGFLATSNQEWLEALLLYKNNLEVREKHGTAGLALIKKKFTVKSQLPRLKQVFAS